MKVLNNYRTAHIKFYESLPLSSQGVCLLVANSEDAIRFLLLTSKLYAEIH